jgi:hypothetical protein
MMDYLIPQTKHSIQEKQVIFVGIWATYVTQFK